MGYGLVYIDFLIVFKCRLIKVRINVIYVVDLSVLKNVLFMRENEINDFRRLVCICNYGIENYCYWYEIFVRK